MRVQYLDLKTGEKAWDSGISEFELTQNNWSCDCNRGRAFDVDHEDGVCAGFVRFVVIDVEYEESDSERSDIAGVIRDANEDYFFRLRESDALSRDSR